MLQMISEVAKSARGDAPRTLASLPSHDITPYARNAGMNVSQWIEQMEFRFKSLEIPQELWVSGILTHVAPDIWSELKRFLVSGAPERTPYSEFISKFKDLHHGPDLARAAMFSLTKAKQFPEEHI